MSYVSKHFSLLISTLEKIDLSSYSFSESFFFILAVSIFMAREPMLLRFWGCLASNLWWEQPLTCQRSTLTLGATCIVQSHGDARFQFVGNCYKLIWGLKLSAQKPG